MANVRFCFVLHNHQPIGNFDSVIESACAESYLPFLDVVEQHPFVRFALHTSGCLMEWLVERRPEYVERLGKLVDQGQVEILGGGFYEPILTMIPSRDRVGQIRGYSEYLADQFHCRIRGMWVPERVWEQSLVSDIAHAGIEYTILDDFHFHKAGLRASQLVGYFLTEDQGRLLRIFPGSEPMRYMIPWYEVHEVIRRLRELAEAHPGATVVFADDGEKFGAWPGTAAHVFKNRWLARFFEALGENRDWIELCTPSQLLDETEPLGRTYLPDCSYREMTEWALPADRQLEYEQLWRRLDHEHEGWRLKEFIKAGNWRNFKAKYPETGDMYARMLQVSDRLEALCRDDPAARGDRRIDRARRQLYRGQCNCAYWHGAFGGLYFPHLRNAVYSSLLEAENGLIDYAHPDAANFVAAASADLNLDGRPEVLLENRQLAIHVDPHAGGAIYELDVRPVAVNLAASLSRRPEPYHQKLNNGAGDALRLRHPGAADRLIYDRYARRLLLDHFLHPDASIESLRMDGAQERGDFIGNPYVPTVRATKDEACVTLVRNGHVDGTTVSIAKSLKLNAADGKLEVCYRLEGKPAQPVRFAIELNFAALAAGADDRYFLCRRAGRLAPLGAELDVRGLSDLSLIDEWLGISIGLEFATPARIWSFPIETVSQSEGECELVHQCTCVLLGWDLPETFGEWGTEFTIEFRCARNT